MGSGKIDGIYVALRGDYRQLKADMDTAKAVVKDAAVNMSDAMGGAVAPDKLKRSLNSLVADLAQLQRSSKTGAESFKGIGFAASDLGTRLNLPEKQLGQLQARMMQTQAAESQISALRRIGQQAGLTTAEIRRLGVQMGVSNQNIAKATGGSSSFLSSLPLAGIGGAAAGVVSGAALYSGGKAAFDAGIEAQKITSSYKTIEGSAVGARQQLAFLRDESGRLGTQFQESAVAAKTFFAAGKGTSLEPDMRNIYSAVTEAGTALNLSQDELSGVFLALGQMISKGKVQAEELRGQLGERLPGAFGLAAKAMGVTTGELDKLLESGKVTAEDMLPKLADALHNKFGKAAKEAAEGGAQAVNRMSTEWEDFKANVLDNSMMISGIKGVTNALKDANGELLQRKMIDSGMRGDVLAMGDDYTVTYTEQQIKAFKEYGTIVTEEINRAQQAKQRAAREDYAIQATEKAIGKASSTSKSFLSDTDVSKRQKIQDESAEAVKAQEEARAKDLENASRYDKRIVQIKAETSRKLAEIGKSQISASRTALESMAVDLAKANDVYGEGDGALAALQKKHAEYTKTLGASNPKVKEFSELIAYANQHMGHTPAEVAKVNRASEDQIDVLYEEIHAIQAVASIYGEDQGNQLTMLRARTAAQKDYVKSTRDGADEATAAQTNLLAIAKAQADIDSRKDGAARSVAVNYSGAAYEAEKQDIAATYELASKHTTDQEALERGKNERLAELEEKRLQATGRAQDGMTAALRKYSREAGNDGANMFDMWTSSIKGTEDALVQMGTTGKINVTSLFETIRAEFIRTQLVRPAMSAFTGALESGALWSGAQGIFSSIFHDGGTVGESAAPMRAISPAVFAGAPRFHNGLASDEYPAILQTGEDVISRRQKAQMRSAAASSSSGSGGGITMPVTIINNAGESVQATARQSTTSQGGPSLEVMIDKLVAQKLATPGSATGKALRTNFGVTRQLTRR